MMDILFKSHAGVISVVTIAILCVMGAGLAWWFKHKMDHPNED